ncbi:MAG: twin-arginine translocase TatA/TatE family subunit [Pseudomonadota bacterium]
MVPNLTPLFINNIGPLGLIVILVVVLLLFGRGKIPALMGDVAKGIKSFKKGMKEDPDDKDGQIEDNVAKSGAIDVTPDKNENKA